MTCPVDSYLTQNPGQIEDDQQRDSVPDETS